MMYTTHEIIEYSKEWPLKLFFQRIGFVPRHWHRSIEILLVLSGELKIQVDDHNYTLNSNDVILINSNQPHETYSKDCVLIALQIRLSMFKSQNMSPEETYFNCNSTLQHDTVSFDIIRGIIARLVQTSDNSAQFGNLLSSSLIYRLMYELVTHFKAETPNTSQSGKHMERLKSITEYIESNFDKNVTLTSIAEKEFLSPSYLSYFFEKTMNISLSNYISKVRIEHSLPLLLYSEFSLEEISEKCGFPSPRSYSALFKKQFKVLPSQYRKEQSNNPHVQSIMASGSNNYLYLEKTDVINKLSTYLLNPEPLLEEGYKHSKLFIGKIDTKKKGMKLQHHCFNFCSVGRARDLLYANVQQMLKEQQAEIGFRYIKFHGLFDDSLMVYKEDSNGDPVLNFNMLDHIFDFLLNINLRPLVQFSFMPAVLAKNPNKTFFVNPVVLSEPKDDSKWKLLVSSFVGHFIHRYGLAEVSQWIFTFWNETLSDFPFDFGSTDITLRLYKATYEAVKQHGSMLKFASMSFTSSDFPEDNYTAFLNFAGENNCYPDIYLFHFYPIQSGKLEVFKQKANEVMCNTEYLKTLKKLLMDADAFHKYIDAINSNLPKRSSIPLYITEWNLSPSHRELLNDTCYASAYFMRNILQNYDKVDSFCHWSLTDWIEELDFPSDLFHGGIGHFTINGVKKPAYYTYKFLRSLKDELLCQGESYFVTRSGNDFAIILYNYFHFTNLYSSGINFDFSFTERYRIFANASMKEIDFTLTGVCNGEYVITEQFINRRYGSCFDKWVEMGAMPLHNTEELQRLKNLSEPFLHSKNLAVEAESIHYETELEPHEIRLILIHRKN